MNRLRYTYHILLAMLLGAASCNDDEVGTTMPGQGEAVLLKGIRAHIGNDSGTRAMPPALIDSIGKYKFQATDEIIFTKIERTHRPIVPTYSYSDVHYSCTVSGPNVSWKLNREDDIYWSDGLSPHTFIGYILPHEDEKTAGESGFDWKQNQTAPGVFYGSIGNPTVTKDEAGNPAIIDYYAEPGPDNPKPYDLEKLRQEDLLLSYTTEQQNGDDAMADIHFHHGLASVRVVVTITGYSATGTDPDAETLVSDMMLHKQPTLYKWDQNSYQAMPLEAADQAILDGIWGPGAVSWNQTKDMKLWQAREYHGSNANRTFSFYGIVAPGQQDEVNMKFKVTYPYPLDPKGVARQEKVYTAKLKLAGNAPVEFRAGYVTNINVNLNHKDEKMTVGAEYMEWQFIDQPDLGRLRTNSPYLETTERKTVTILGDELATVDDATWLYTSASGQVVDIYGNYGTEAKPFHICTADQLLSFAHEVNGTNRAEVTITDHAGQSRTIAGGFDFSGYYIKLDANLILQETMDNSGVSWIGIGTTANPFNGTFLGEQRSIKRLMGKPLFINIGPQGRVDGLKLEDVLGITSDTEGGAALAHLNQGVVCASIVTTDAFSKEPVTIHSITMGDNKVAGLLTGNNQGIVMACHSLGSFRTDATTIGGLVGCNTGAVVVSYAAAAGTTSANTVPVCHGIAGINNDAPDPLPAGKTANEYGTLTYCLFDQDIARDAIADNQNVTAKTTLQMQSGDFIGTAINPDEDSLNGQLQKYASATSQYPKAIIDSYTDAGGSTTRLEALMNHFLSHYYTHRVADYPVVN